MTETYLVADIGGTNTRVGLANDSGLISDSTRRFRNAENASFEAVLQAYIAEMQPGALAGACAGAAGPVQAGVAKMTNLDWHIDRATMAQVTGAPVVDVINDLQAQGFALDDLSDGCTTAVLDADEPSEGPRLVVGLGTGFNIVPVHVHGAHLVVPSCEAGHATLPYSPGRAALCEWLSKECGYASVEVALAGQGIENLFQFHSGTKRSAADVMVAFEAGDAPAVRAMTDYGALLGTVIGDYILNHLPFGGVFLTGGVARAVAPHLHALGFAEAKADKGRFSDLAASVGVRLITDDFAALKGCARHLRQLAER